MSSDHFKFIMIEIPKVVSLETIKSVRNFVSNLSAEDAVIINKEIELDTSDVQIDDLDEDDLFHIGEEKLKIKKAMIEFLEEGIDMVLLPRVGIENRIGSIENNKSFAYLEISSKLYAVTGNQVAYYSSRSNNVFKHFLAINLSGVLQSI